MFLREFISQSDIERIYDSLESEDVRHKFCTEDEMAKKMKIDFVCKFRLSFQNGILDALAHYLLELSPSICFQKQKPINLFSKTKAHQFGVLFCY